MNPFHVLGMDTTCEAVYRRLLSRPGENERELAERLGLSHQELGAQTRANMRASRPLNQKLLERAVQMRTIYLDSLRHDRASVAHAEWLTRRGGEVRTVPTLPNRMIICDRKVALVAIDNERTGAGAVVVRTGGLIETLRTLFSVTWRRARPLGTPERQDSAGFTPQQAEVLRLLAQGYTDQAVGKRLGVSPRTARRLATEIMLRVDARSRFQAGVRAAQRKWLPESEF